MVVKRLRIVAIVLALLIGVVGLGATSFRAAAGSGRTGPHWLEQANSPTNKYRVVVHVDDFEYTGTWWLSMKNISELRQQLGHEGLAIELVVDGNGVAMLTKDNEEMASQLQEFASSGIRLVVGQDAMAAANISQGKVLPFVTVVPSSVAEIAQRRAEHWAYLKL